MNYRDTAQKICSKIADTASTVEDLRMLSMPFNLDINLDGITYEAAVTLPDDDIEHVEEVQVQSLIFPCDDFSVIGKTAVFSCVDPAEAAAFKCVTLGQVSTKIAEAGIDSIDKAVVRMRGNGKQETAVVQDVEYCDIAVQPMFGGKTGVALYCVELDKVLDLSYTSTINKIAEQKLNDEMHFSESMKKLSSRFYENEETKFHEYHISFVTQGKTGAKHVDVEASTIEDAMKSFNEKVADEFPECKVTKVTNIACDGKMVSKKMLDAANASLLDECDTGAAGGDAGAVAGDAGAATSMDTGDTAAEMSGITTTDVLGKCVPGDGYMGKDNFYIPARAKVPMHRWEAANGGSKRKKKNKKYDYEKGAKVVVSMFEDEMLNEFEDKFSTYEYLRGKDWEDVVADVKATGKMQRLPEYERWEAAQLDAPDEDEHGVLGGCTIDEDKYKREYLKEYFIHGIYKDGEMFELGPMKRKVASHYLDLHKLKVNDRAFQQMIDRGFSEIKTIGEYVSQTLDVAKFKDGFWLVDPRGTFKAGPFSNKQLARMYAKEKKYKLDKGVQSDKNKAEEGYRLEYPMFAFSYKMAGVPCMDIVVAEDLPRAMKRFDTQWRMFDNSRSTRDKFSTVQDLQRDLSLLFIKDIEIEELTPENIDEYVELAEITGNPSTIPELKSRCKNPKFQYILGTEGKTGRLVIQPFTEADEYYI